jgi:uncharacterized delta-60 repeat protein
MKRSPLTAHRSPLTAHRSPLTAHRSPLTAHRSPLTALTALTALTLSVGVLGAPGDVDLSFSPGPDSEANTPTNQPDGKIVVAGDFATIGGFGRRKIARLGADGLVDTGFNPHSGGFVRQTTLQDDGRVLIGGEFTTMGGVDRSYIARVLADGSLDLAFNPAANADIYATAVEADGRVLLGGIFEEVNGTGRSRLARVSAGGVLDATFNPGANDNVRTILLTEDGKILIAGNFTSVGGMTRARVARLLNSGAVDPGFNAAVDGPVYSMAQQADGRILIGGSFATVGGQPRTNIARLLADGAVDESYNTAANGLVRTIAVQTDGKAIIAGDFTMIGGVSRNQLARLLGTGMLDPGFAATPASGGLVFGVTVQADGKILVGGRFTTIGGQARPKLARLQNDAVSESLAVHGNHRILWLRGGAAPEAQRVTFRVSTDGGTVWVPLGAGSRIAGGWELRGLNLPWNGRVSALARTPGGYGGSCTGVVQAVANYTFDPLRPWREANFGTPNNTGPAADNADPDKDGLENLVEFAFGLNPNTPDAAALPEWELLDDDYSLTFTQPAGVDGITYIAEYSPDMAPGSWTPAVNVSSPPAYQFFAPAIAQRQYVRVRVTSP